MLGFVSRRWGQFVLAAALFVLPSPARAQSDTATVSGRITDQTGQVLSEVTVRVTNVDTGIETPALSNDGGTYVARNLRPGRYRVVVEKDGFRTIVLDPLVLAVGDVLGRNFTMQIGPVKDSVTVTADRDRHNLSPAVSTVVDRQFIENMPLNGRSFQSLIQLTPGSLVTVAGQEMEGQFSVNGQRTNTNYFTVDGVSVNFGVNTSINLGQNVGGSLPAMTIGGGTNSFVSVDAMEEFRTQTSTYAPEFGREPGAQITIATRSGTNQLHGTVYDYVRNEAFDARNWFNPPPESEPPLRQQDFGGSAGGPVVRNRSFFFFSYEGLRLRQPNTSTGLFYTPETRTAVAPVYQPIVKALPIPDGPLQDPTCDNVSRPCLASLTVSSSNPTSFDAYSLRVDQTLGRFTLFARGSHTPSVEKFTQFASVTSSSRNTDLVTAGATAILSASLLNDLRVGWGRSTGRVETEPIEAYGAVPPPESSMFPPGQGPDGFQESISLPGGSVVVGTRVSHVGRQLNVVDTFSLIRAAHHLKVGVDYRRAQPTGQGGSGYILLLADFNQLTAGTMGQVAVVAAEEITVGSHNWSVFAQDSWMAAERVTLTYGLRWEVNTPPVSLTAGNPLYAVQGVFDAGPLQLAPAGTPLWRTRYDNIAPRIGAAYQIASAMVLRGGVGLFHDLGYGGFLGSLVNGFPYTRQAVRSGAGQPFDLQSPIFQPPPISTSLNTLGQSRLFAFDPDLELPVTTQWNVAVERELGATQTLGITYVGARGHGLLRPDAIVPAGASGPRVVATRNAGRSRYDALQIQLRRRLSRGVQALASYTLAQARDQESDDIGGNFLGAAWNTLTASSLATLQMPPLAPADFDIRHAFSTAVSYELPAPAWGKAARAVLGDWAVDGIVRASTPLPLNVRIEGVSPEVGVYRTQPDLVPGQPIWLEAPDQPGRKILNPDAFTLPPPGSPGSFPRNSIRSPFWISQTDLALRRQFPLARARSLEFRAEFFNLFNTPMFGGPSAPTIQWGRCAATPCTGKQSALFGKVAEGATLNHGLGGSSLEGGQSAIYAVGGPRSIQFSLKLRF